ncbi:IclR family transcriptional regulator [Orrella sp. JC864]|uniref:IclR family transcriptional regulator n=1 Tax=Orrella sp. JC864 TaxID=3120298 RepID=UPI003009792B
MSPAKSDVRSAAKDASATSFLKMAQVLDCFTKARSRLSVGELVVLTGLPRTTVHRIVSSLREIGMLDQDGRRRDYRLGLKMFHYGSVVIGTLDVHRHAGPHLQQLNQLSGEIVHFHMFDGSQMACIEREVMSGNHMTTLTTIEAAPIYCTSVGKAFLAFQPEPLIRRICAEQGLVKHTANTITDMDRLFEVLADIRRQGYAIDDEENAVGVRCVGAPVRNAAGQVFAAVSVSGPTDRMPDRRLTGLAPVVIDTANRISEALAS